MFFVLIRIASSRRFYWVHSTYNDCLEDWKNHSKLSYVASWPGTMINPQWLELHVPMSRTIFHVPSDVRAHHENTPKNNFDPLKPHFYIVELGFTGVYIIFLILFKNINCGNSLEPPRRGGSYEYLKSIFWAEIWKISELFIWKFSFFCGKGFSIFV